MVTTQYTIENEQIRALFAKAPELVTAELSRVVSYATNIIARAARRGAPKAFSTLTNSIIGRQINPLTGEVTAGVDYARMVEEGTGPGGKPPLQTITDWIRVKRITPRDPTLSPVGLAYVIAQSIAEKGTPAQPFMAPAVESSQGQIQRRADRAIDDLLRKMATR